VAHSSREKLDLVNRTKKVVGQLESVLRALHQDEPCADVCNAFPPRVSRSAGEAADDVIQIIRTYLK
jgi:DNA-binding FrmR family transcriptional regulator